jgi:hypothetical protein
MRVLQRCGLLTGSGSSRHTLASGTVNSASILLEGLVGGAANTVGNRAGIDLAAGDAVNTLDVGDGGGRDGNKAKEDGGNGELHFDWRVVFGVYVWYY